MVAIFNKRTLPDIVDEFFGKDFMSDFGFTRKSSVPAVNIVEDASTFYIEVGAPGMNKDDFNIDLNNNVLTVFSEREVELSKEGGRKYLRREFSYATFKRSFSLPESVEIEKIKAAYIDGVLKIEIPKKEDGKQSGPRQIIID